MVKTELSSQLLTHELQLGEQLNHCVHSDRRADFALMLAMLADDAREYSQFHLPKKAQDGREQPDYRALFQLPAEQPLALESLDQIEQYYHADAVAEQRLADIKLKQALAPEPLAFRDDKTHIPHQVKTNTSLFCQQKQQQQDKYKALTQDAGFNAKKWLDSINTAIVKQDIISPAQVVSA